MTLDDPRQYRLGVLYVAISALAWSTSGLFIRTITTDLMTMLFWRGLVSGSCVLMLFFYIERGAAITILKRMRAPSFMAMFFSAVSMISGIGSMYYTSVADAMVIYATVPFVTAGVAYLWIGEKATRATLIASAVAICGVLVMLADSGGESGGLLGKGLAVIMTISVAALATVMRKYRGVPMLPAMAGSAWLCSLLTFSFAAPLSVSASDMGLIVVFGIVQNAVGLILYTAGSRRVPAADASLLTSLEVPLTPLWVWLILGETPSAATMIGGPIVLAALFGHIFHEVRRDRTDVVTS